ncbi:restriction endonuclease [Actinobacillus suis]|uniref:Restriction endonuclease n=2 Tax=Actinobacillus suis TaxID=716 RepID=K0FXQ0_ACTSU|nr:restriction endonuclease [Actinobacillus suis]AFU19217.1 restriction endonuclease [Actinobacillus suis H91-0380]AIJ31356.1 restriction endonuclease [Actinobacillus suis ATCC 33415]MCO4166631.1 restriction endonuclease [Actinobacillus suis]MCO4168088.1 restriction endonuclease [Actinobacillus suis]MCQ9629511.1 restriction endonuclease [Actinobacillus suis]
MNFEEMNRWQKMGILESAIIDQLRKLGGKSSRKKLRSELRENLEAIPEEAFDERKIGKNGRPYCPLDIIIQFTLKNLEIAGFISFPERGQLALTERGIICDLNNVMDKEAQQRIHEYWTTNKGNRKKNRDVEELQNFNTPLNIESHIMPEKHIDEIGDDDEELEEGWEAVLRNRLAEMQPQKFELFCRKILEEIGFEMDEKLGVVASRDGGIDGYGYFRSNDLRTSRVAIQAKRWNNSKVGSPEIDQFRGVIDKFNAEYGIFITTSEFSRAAIEAAKAGSKVITLIDGEDIIELVKKYKIGIKTKLVKQIELDSFYFDEIEG